MTAFLESLEKTGEEQMTIRRLPETNLANEIPPSIKLLMRFGRLVRNRARFPALPDRVKGNELLRELEHMFPDLYDKFVRPGD